ncbi:MAG: T9SS type A sorting domain-containing protein [Bacteroidia bacterium]|nr:T9SS type A sorting domain-containing protein [Bacteroidia bacterium]
MNKRILFIVFLLFQYSTFAQLSWIKKQDFPGFGKSGVAAFAINGKGYMGLGIDSLSDGRNEWFEYDAASNTWAQKTSLPDIGRWSCASFVINGKGYVVAGATNSGLLNQTWEYDPILDNWTVKANFPGIVRQDAAGFSISGKGYVGTGYGGGNAQDDFYEFDPLTNIWTARAIFPGGERTGAAGFSIGTNGYIGMGTATNSVVNYNDLYQYNPLTDTWSQRASYPLPAIDAATTYSSSDDAYVICGYFYQYQNIEHNPMNLVHKYNASTDSWSLLGTFPGLPRGYAGGFALTNDIYISCGGNNNYTINTSTQISDLWKLTNGLTLRIGSISTPDIEISPNPAAHTIQFGSEVNGKKLEQALIYDVTGKLIKQISISDNSTRVDVKELRAGIYFVELITADGILLDGSFVKE